MRPDKHAKTDQGRWEVHSTGQPRSAVHAATQAQAVDAAKALAADAGAGRRVSAATGPSSRPTAISVPVPDVDTAADGPELTSPFPHTRQMKITDARAGLADIVRDASMLDEPTVITQNGKPAAVVIGIEEYRAYLAARDERLVERIQARADSAEWMDHDEVVRQFSASITEGK